MVLISGRTLCKSWLGGSFQTYPPSQLMPYIKAALRRAFAKESRKHSLAKYRYHSYLQRKRKTLNSKVFAAAASLVNQVALLAWSYAYLLWRSNIPLRCKSLSSISKTLWPVVFLKITFLVTIWQVDLSNPANQKFNCWCAVLWRRLREKKWFHPLFRSSAAPQSG